MSDVSTVLPQGAGYGVGIGLFFSAFMLGLTALQARYTPFKPSNNEEFSSASRSVKPGLIASGIVSAWTWAATLLQSSAVAYKYGISGPWWYGAGATVQVLLFAQLAAKLKMNAPSAHTWLEIVHARWGVIGHLIFMFFGFATNIIVSSMLILGGSATVTDLTGMSTIAACFLIPLGVAIYVIAGGMRATLLCDYTHTTVLFAILFTFIFTVYATSPKIGSIGRMHELLAAASESSPVPGNAHGSYLTMRSKNGLVFGVINIIGNFATVFNDQAYWQRAIASRPASCVKAYLIGGLAWFAIPFTFATTLGLAAIALKGDPDMRILSPADVSAGLPAPSAAAALLGKSGAAAMLVLLFLAVTSATSAELIAVSSILTYDVYKVAIYALIMGLAGLIFFYIGVSMGWLYVRLHICDTYLLVAKRMNVQHILLRTQYNLITCHSPQTFMGVILGSAVVPIALCVTWRKANKVGCIVAAISGFWMGIIAWLVTTSSLNNKVINVTTSGGDFEMLAGNLASIGVGAIISAVWSLISPADFDFAITRAINAPPLSHEHVQEKELIGESSRKEGKDDYTDDKTQPTTPVDVQSISDGQVAHIPGVTDDSELDHADLKSAFKFAAWSSVILLLVMIIIIPLPLFFAQTIYGVRGLGAWVIIGIVWAFCSAFTVVIYPLYESRAALLMVSKGLVKLRDAIAVQTKHGPREVDMLMWMSRAALEIIGTGGLGTSIDPLSPDPGSITAYGSSNNNFRFLFPTLQSLGPASFRRLLLELAPSPDLHKVKDIVDIMATTSCDIFREKLVALKQGDEAITRQVGEGKDVMSILLKANTSASMEDRLPEDELIAQMSTFMFAGHDTTSSALSHIFHCLSENQQEQEKLRSEIVTSGIVDRDQVVYDELMALPYLDAVCRETLRVHPPVNFMARTAQKDVILPLGIPCKSEDGLSTVDHLRIRKGQNIIVAFGSTNRLKEVWGADANEWKPERWLKPLPTSVSDAHIAGVYSSLMTFSAGPRSCIGFKYAELEMKLILSVLLKSFKFELPIGKTIIWNLGGIQTPAVKGAETQTPQLPLLVSRV
ncbi:hypothetical protein EW145_g2548 [Phellinidium pouzarii]|uniref:Urea transporter n=1 Tax=Phellinidium pouzarii TaxID=167371 RepID=A0A4S4LAF1_9AGAM|nr:hypothetical protein EW145_g2548 [Phellinidium pouzarii]